MIEEISVYLSLNGTIRDPASYDRFGSNGRVVSSLTIFKLMQVTFLVHECDFFFTLHRLHRRYRNCVHRKMRISINCMEKILALVILSTDGEYL